MLVLQVSDVRGDLGGDERVAVPVAADPGAERERPGRRARAVHAERGQRLGQVVEHLARRRRRARSSR